jgi:hypothetical protein
MVSNIYASFLTERGHCFLLIEHTDKRADGILDVCH